MMVREGFPKISKPLPAKLREWEYSATPVEQIPKEISAFEEQSDRYSWLQSLWNNIISAKWPGALLPTVRESFQSIPISENLSLPLDRPKVSLRATSTSKPLYKKDISPLQPISPPVTGTQSTYDDVLEGIVKYILYSASDLDELNSWLELEEYFAVGDTLKRAAIDYVLFKSNPPAWETIAYLSGEDCKIEDCQKAYLEGQKDIEELRSFIDVEIEKHRVLLALWRIWAYCIISVDAMCSGEYIAIQVQWLRGPTVDRAVLGKPLHGTHENWKIRQTNGIFAQGNYNLEKNDRNDMGKIWDIIKEKWVDVTEKQHGNEDENIMHVFSRVSGPRDILKILKNRQSAYLDFHRALRIIA